MREITATELTIGCQREKGYLGYGVKGDFMLQCSSYDRIILFWKDGRYKVLAPPEKLFVGEGIVNCGVADRDRVFTVVYREEMLTYAKRFTVGGTILGKEYRCTPEGAEVLLFADDSPPVIYVKYVSDSTERIQQQEFGTARLRVRDPKSRGAMMTSKRIAVISERRPAVWDEKLNGPNGMFMDFGAP